MYRILFLLAVGFGLMACSNNDKKIGSWETNDVYRSTITTPNPTNGGVSYVAPPINTMGPANTYEMYSLRSEQAKGGLKSYEMLVHLTYFTQWRYYDSATLEKTPATTFKVVSRQAGVCEEQGCIFKELLSIELTDAFLRDHLKNGFQITISSKTGNQSNLYVPPEYIKGYLKAVDDKS